jgi:hypothetical protein
MENKYVYEDLIWKSLFSDIRLSRIFSFFNKSEIYKSNFNHILDDLVALTNYSITANNQMVYLAVIDKGIYFDIQCNWKSTKVKCDFFKTINEEICIQKRATNNYINWRNTLFESYLNLINRSDDFQIDIDTQKNVKIFFKLYLKKISPNYNFEVLKNSYIVELENKSVDEIYKIGLKFLDINDTKCINILSRIIDIKPFVKVIIGFAYKNLKEYEVSNQYLIDFFDEFEDSYELSDDLTAVILETIATNNLNLGKVDYNTVEMFLDILGKNQSHTALLKISYIILSKNIKNLKLFALENVNIATDFALNHSDEFDKSCAFHIICSVLVWNDKFLEAEKYHHYFLTENFKFYIENQELVKAYILLLIAKNNTEFVGNIILDFPHIKKKYDDLFDVWYFNNGNVLNKKETNLIIFHSRLLERFINEYCD